MPPLVTGFIIFMAIIVCAYLLWGLAYPQTRKTKELKLNLVGLFELMRGWVAEPRSLKYDLMSMGVPFAHDKFLIMLGNLVLNHHEEAKDQGPYSPAGQDKRAYQGILTLYCAAEKVPIRTALPLLKKTMTVEQLTKL